MPTPEELQTELKLRDHLERERFVSDHKYAIKLVETIVFTLIGAIALGVIAAIIDLIFKRL